MDGPKPDETSHAGLVAGEAGRKLQRWPPLGLTGKS